MNIQIENMSPSHIDGIEKIENNCFSTPWTYDGIKEELENENSHFLVAIADEIIAGYIGVQEICGEAYITNVGVLSAFRRNSIAQTLMEKAIDGAKERKCEFITLEVRESNIPAISLYEKLHFEKCGRRKNFYSNPTEDGIIYTLKLITD